jgi:hypothetical protein
MKHLLREKKIEVDLLTRGVGWNKQSAALLETDWQVTRVESEALRCAGR